MVFCNRKGTLCHQKFPKVTSLRVLALPPEVAICHRKWPYVTESVRMSLEVCRSCLSYCEADVDRACRPKIIQLCVYNSIVRYSCGKPINTKKITTMCNLISHTQKSMIFSCYLLTAVVKVSIGGPSYSILNLREPKSLLFKEVSFICLKVQVWKQ